MNTILSRQWRRRHRETLYHRALTLAFALGSLTEVRGYQPAALTPLRSRSLFVKTLPARQALLWRNHRKGSQRGISSSLTLSSTATALSPAPTPAGNAYMVLLALQFALQPIVTKNYASKKLIKGTYVFWLDVMRAVICISTLCLTKSWTAATVGWNWRDAVVAAGLPSILYVAQNYFSLEAYQNLSPITFNVLNQTKTLSAALWCYVIIGHKLDIRQVGALGILLMAALVMENIVPLPFIGRRTQKKSDLGADDETIPLSTTATTHDPVLSGVVPVLLASLLSGLAGALAQRALQTRQRNSLLFSLELAICSLMTSSVTLGLLPTPDHNRLVQQGWWCGWTALTWVPLLLQASGGVLVGLVTKYAGSVRKGFCLIQGMFLSGVLQNWLDSADKKNQVRVEQWIGGILAALSFWMYTQS